MEYKASFKKYYIVQILLVFNDKPEFAENRKQTFFLKQSVRTFRYCNEDPCDTEVPPGTTLGGTYDIFYRQFVVNGGIESSWLHQYCRTDSCHYFGNNGDDMDLSSLYKFNEAGFYRFRQGSE